MDNKLNLKEYQKLCKATAKKFDDSDKDKEISNWGLGVAGEAGDLAGCIKKTIFHNNNQEQGIRENIGDVMWYLAMICNFYDWDFEEVLKENIDKLEARYKQGHFTEQDAKRKGERIDWMEK